MSRDLESAIAKIEDHFRPCRIEYAHFFTQAGELVRFVRGKKDKVEIPKDINPQGMILTHNHPNGSSFSPQDCYVLLKVGLKEIRAYGKYGVYSLLHPNPRPRGENPELFKDLKKMFKKNPRAVQDFAEQHGLQFSFVRFEGEALR